MDCGECMAVKKLYWHDVQNEHPDKNMNKVIVCGGTSELDERATICSYDKVAGDFILKPDYELLREVIHTALCVLQKWGNLSEFKEDVDGEFEIDALFQLIDEVERSIEAVYIDPDFWMECPESPPTIEDAKKVDIITHEESVYEIFNEIEGPLLKAIARRFEKKLDTWDS